MDPILLTFVCLLLFYNILGWGLRYYLRNKHREEVKAELNEQIRVVRLEVLSDPDIILAFDAEDHRFLGQGTTEQEIETVVKERFPKNIFILNQHIFTAVNELQLNNETSNAS